MEKIRAPDVKEKAKQDYLSGMKYKELAEKYEVSINTIKSWVKRYGWAKEKNKGAHKTKKRGAPYNNKNAVGNKGGGAPLGNKNAIGNDGGAPEGNLNALKHGAYQSLYANMLSGEEKAMYEQISATTNIDEEIKLLRLKIARLLNRERSFFYNMFGKKIEKEISEEDRINGINACMDQLRKLIEAKAKIAHDSEKLQIEKEKFEFDKYKADIELKLKQEKLELEKTKITGDEGEIEDDGFLDALSKEAKKVWNDNEN
ncbi:terminase gpP N-terminus-related DNA-binding protein [Caminicella sporogenes]|uniref:terminase gpP N-terminus-related DNA-binding protein n=1 Tax=Caminicella sporogenes TaxID=166485 RepID=UPI0025410F30|nr:terminase [Caminicella sporogenes]WIF95035.1 terminase [Caminicella sporogenes]